jgi:hypothetical protein
MKVCTKCNEQKTLENFSWKDKNRGRKASECKSCHKIMRLAYYQANKTKERQRANHRRMNLKAWYRDLKKTLCCHKCRESHPAILHFHHKVSNQKELEISIAINHGWSKERILKEMNKCEVLCANCHAKHHWDERYE